jgi:uncharacterized cofD-like protein
MQSISDLMYNTISNSMEKNGKIKDKPRIVVIGGGTGTFVVLKGLKNYPVHLSAIVAMSDSGGSNKRIRDEFGLLPTSDIRQCLVALSEEDKEIGIMRQLFMYRFGKGEGIAGMTFANLFMAALTDILGSQKDAITATSKVLKIHGKVIPVSYTDTNLYATYENGLTVTEEHLIDEPVHDGTMKITDIHLKPEAEANIDAIKAIKKADMIILGPGDLYTSILPNLLVKGISDAINESNGHVVYIMNLMTKYGQTYNFAASDHVHMITKYLGNTPDSVIINSSPIPKKILSVYAKSKEFPVKNDIQASKQNYRVFTSDIVSRFISIKSDTDVLIRSLIRHDSDALAEVLFHLLPEDKTKDLIS